MKIPFDIKFRPQIESGEYKVVIEYDNRTFYARIVCWDFNSTELLACVNYGDREDVLEYDSSGKHIGKSVRRPDLFLITPEPELSEFEKAVGLELFDEPFEERHIKVIKEESAKLLGLARNEIVKSGYAIIEGEHYLEDGRKNYERGKAEALEDLPRWRKEQGEMELAAYGIIGGGVASQENPRVYLNGHSIDLYSLEKLPGFNE